MSLEDNLEKIWVWKKMLKDDNSSTGQDMMRSSNKPCEFMRNKAKKCVECDGTKEYAEKLRCRAYIVD
ncbi:MAG: hypothetical protein ABIG37_02210 [Nanoarchaeota archaeon]|nr:hypothetical protein [Nanoarchaeota archaeon]